MKLKIIKSKKFEAKGVAQIHYTVAYKGRVFGVSSMRFEPEQLVVTGDILSIECHVEVLKNVSVDQLTGETKTFLDIVPEMDLNLVEF